MLAGLAFLAFDLSRRSTAANGTATTLLKCLGWCAGLALIAALLLGQGTCVSGDPLFGYCEEREGGFVPSLASRVGQFVCWFLLLVVPALIGAFDSSARLKAFLRKTKRDAS
jgi:hypothetical protein